MTSEFQHRIDDRLKRIANILLLNASFINKLGLLNGKMGIAIFFFHYARYTGNKVYENYAGELIDEIYEGIDTRILLDFSDGLTGIGWGIEYLVQNGFISAETDDILEDIDEAVYQKILFQLSNDDLQGCLLYYLARLRSKSDESNIIEKQLNTHALLCLLGKCEKLLTYWNSEKQIELPNLDTLNIIHIFLKGIKHVELFRLKAEKLLVCLPIFFEMETEEIIGTDHNDITDQVTFLLRQQLFFSSEAYMKTDFTSLYKSAIEYFIEEKYWEKRIDNLNIDGFGLNKGISGIALLLLLKIEPLKNSLTSNFKEKFKVDKKERLNVFLIVHDYSGARTYSNELSSFFTKNNNNIATHQVFLNSLDHKEFTIQNESNIVNIYIPQKIEKEYSNKYYKSAASLLISHFNHLDKVVFHANMPEHYFFAEEAKRFFNCPLVFTLHFLENFYSYLDMFPEQSDNIEITGNALIKKMLALADHIICVTEFSKRTIVKFYQITPSKINIIYNGNSFQKHNKEGIKRNKNHYGFSPDDQLLLYAGQLEIRKGVDKIIKAFLLIKDKLPKLKLVIAGTGNYDKFMPLAKECLGRVYFTGKLDKSTLVDFYRFSNVGILPSQNEQCSYVVIEMIQHCLPIIISNVPGLNELITHEKTGMVCKVIPSESNNIVLEVSEIDLALQIEYVLQNRILIKNMAQKAQELALNRHSLKKMGEETIKIYRKLIEEKYEVTNLNPILPFV